jgi:hypothetical protein
MEVIGKTRTGPPALLNDAPRLRGQSRPRSPDPDGDFSLILVSFFRLLGSIAQIVVFIDHFADEQQAVFLRAKKRIEITQLLSQFYHLII